MASGIVHNIFRGGVHGIKHNALVYGGSIVAATPTFQAVGAKAEGIGDVTVNWPAHAANDVALLFVESNGTEAAVLGTPAGFVEIPGSPQIDTAGGNQTRLTVFWCRASSGAMASPVVTDPGDHCEAVIVTYRGCRTFDVPYSATAGSSTAGVPTNSISVPGTNSGAPNCRVVIAISNGGGWDGSGYTNANLTGITERFDDFTGLAGAGGLSIADGAYAGPGDYGATAVTIGAVNTCAYMSIALTGSSGSGESSFAAALTAIGTPINAARIWTTGLSDDNRMVLQAYNYPNEVPTEWFVLNLNTGTNVKVNGPNRTPANSNFTISSDGSTNSDAVGGNQLRASNGRIFFPCAGLNVAYYDPTTKTVAHLTPPTDSSNSHAVVYSMQFGKDGLLYGSTQTDSGTGSLPAVVKLDPATLTYTLIGHVGTAATLLYGYYTVAEYDGSYVYVAVGQDPWELWKIHVATGVAAKLTPSGFAGPYTHIEFEDRTEGWCAVFTNGASQARYWVADGNLYAGAPTHNPLDFAARDVTPVSAPLVSAPEIDFSAAGQGVVKWRTRGSTGAYTTVNFSPTLAPIPLDGLVELADTNAFMSASQYCGYSRYNGSFTNQTNGLVSQPVFAEQGTWFSGYPNGALYEYTPGSAWNPGTNPVLRGNYNGGGLLSDMKYPYFLQKYATNNRLYCLGRRERSGVGCGLGYYDITGASFAGHHTTPLDLYQPRGLLVLGVENRVIVSGQSLDDVTAAKLLVYNLDLVLQSQLTVNSNTSTGALFGTGETARLVGVTDTGVYRYNIDTATILAQAGLGFTVTASTQRVSDNKILVAGGGKIVSIDPITLTQTEIVRGVFLDYTITGLSWVGTQIYAVAGPTLYTVT